MRLLGGSCCVVLLPCLIRAAPHVPGQKRQSSLAPQFLRNLDDIRSGLIAVNETLNTFTVNDPLGLLDALAIQQQIGEVGDALTTSAGTANQSGPFNDQESYDISQNFLDLEPIIFSTLNNIVLHKPAFATAILFIGDISQTVLDNLRTQRQLTTELNNAARIKLTQVFQSAAPIIAKQVDDGFLAAISAFQACAGILCLPPISLPFELPISFPASVSLPDLPDLPDLLDLPDLDLPDLPDLSALTLGGLTLPTKFPGIGDDDD